MNHLSHTLSPLILLAAFLISLLTFLSPAPIFSSSVALLKVSGNLTDTAATTLAKRWDTTVSISAPKHRMIFARKANTTSTNTTATTLATSNDNPTTLSGVPIHVFFGPMGACYNFNRKDLKNLTCSAPSFTPIFTPLLDLATVPASLQSHLPDQFPLAPTATFLSILLFAVGFSLSMLSSLPFHTKRFARLEKKQAHFTKLVVWTVAGGLVVGLIAVIALRVELGKKVSDWQGVKGGQGLVLELGSGFTQFWAGYTLAAVGLALTAFSMF